MGVPGSRSATYLLGSIVLSQCCPMSSRLDIMICDAHKATTIGSRGAATRRECKSGRRQQVGAGMAENPDSLPFFSFC